MMTLRGLSRRSQPASLLQLVRWSRRLATSQFAGGSVCPGCLTSLCQHAIKNRQFRLNVFVDMPRSHRSFVKKAVNRVSHFSEGVLKRTFRDPILVFTDGFQVQMPAAKLIAELDGVFAPFGSYPSSYDFGCIILCSLCDDSVRTAGDDTDGWPAEVPSLKKRVILEFVWRFPDGRKLPCR